MSRRQDYESRIQARLDELKSELAELGENAERTEINLRVSYYTLIEESRVKLDAAEYRFEMLKLANEDKWEAFKPDLEQSFGFHCANRSRLLVQLEPAARQRRGACLVARGPGGMPRDARLTNYGVIRPPWAAFYRRPRRGISARSRKSAYINLRN